MCIPPAKGGLFSIIRTNRCSVCGTVNTIIIAGLAIIRSTGVGFNRSAPPQLSSLDRRVAGEFHAKNALEYENS